MTSLLLPARLTRYESSCLQRQNATASDTALILNPGPVTSRLSRGITRTGRKASRRRFQVDMPVLIIGGHSPTWRQEQSPSDKEKDQRWSLLSQGPHFNWFRSSLSAHSLLSALAINHLPRSDSPLLFLPTPLQIHWEELQVQAVPSHPAQIRISYGREGWKKPPQLDRSCGKSE